MSEKLDQLNKVIEKMRSNSQKSILKTDMKPYRRTRRKVERVNPLSVKTGKPEGEAAAE